MIEVERTWNRIGKIWWGFTWRSTLLVIPVIVVGGLLFGFLLGGFAAVLAGSLKALAGIDEEIIISSGQIIAIPFGVFLGCATSIWALKRTFQQKFRDFRIALVQDESRGSITAP